MSSLQEPYVVGWHSPSLLFSWLRKHAESKILDEYDYGAEEKTKWSFR
jgi:hypothetical protein